MVALLTLAGGLPKMELVDLADPATTSAFIVVNDDVMGGVSTSRLGHDGDSLVFSGRLRLENDGGFASMRGPIGAPAGRPALDLRDWRGIELLVRGDGRRYKLTLRGESGEDDPVYRAPFETRSGETQAIRLPFEAFEAWRRGRRLVDAPELDRAALQQIGVLVSDAQAGNFRLELLAIRAYR